MKRATIFLGLLISTLAALALTPAQAVQVEAQLSSPRTAVGQPVQLSILVDGARGAEVPRNFAVDGLQISFRGQSTSVNMVNFQVSMIATYNFIVVPQREGSFTIPALTVTVDGKPYQTSELTLEVVGAASLALPPVAPPVQVQPAQPVQPPPGISSQLPSTGPFRPNPPPQATPAPQPTPSNSVPIDQVAFAELILPDGEVYVGQFVPVEIRLYFDQRFRFELHSMPTFSGEGFTAERLSEPVERTQELNGVRYQVVTFYSAITAVKTGTLQIPGLELSVNVVVPAQQRRSSSPFDDFFGGDPFAGMFSETREVSLNTKPTELTVRSLPTEGKPPGFAGAIGQFEIEQSIAPARGKVGEPLKLTLAIKGQGNFARILAPPLLGDEGWRTYPGSDQFTPNDSVGFGGTKTFNLTVMPLQETQESPFAEFSYFDPTAGRYVTLRTESDPVAIEGGQIARSTPFPASTTAATPDPAKSTPPSAEPAKTEETAIASLTPATTWRPGNFVAVTQRPEFLAAQAAAALAFCCLLAYLLLGVYQSSSGGQQAKARQRLRQLWQSVETNRQDSSRFYEAARDLLAQSALKSGEASVTGSEYRWIEEADLPSEIRTGLGRILQTADQIKYAGSRSPAANLPTEAAYEILQSWHQWLEKNLKTKGGN